MDRFLLSFTWLTILGFGWACGTKYLFGMNVLIEVCPVILIGFVGIGLFVFLNNIYED